MSVVEEVPEESWEALIAELVQLQHDKPAYRGEEYLYDRPWSQSLVDTESDRFDARYSILHRLIALHHIEDPKLDVAQARVRNASSPVGKLPDDVLLDIFQAFMLDPEADPTILAGVCHQWLSIVLGSVGTLIWSRIDVPISIESHPLTELRIRHSLSRSNDHPLELILRGTYVPDALRHYMKASSRLRDVEIWDTAVTSELLPLNGGLDMLKRLSLVSSYEGDMPTGAERVVLATPSPALRAVYVSANGLLLSRVLLDCSLYAAVAHLAVQVRVASPSHSPYEALRGMTGLEYVEWEDCVSPSYPTPATAIDLPHLHTLILFYSSAIINFSSHIEAPALKYLHLVARPDAEAAISPLGQWYTDQVLCRPDQYHKHFPALETVWYTNTAVAPSLLFPLLFDHPKIREVIWESSYPRVEELLGVMSAVLHTHRRDAGADGARPFLTFCHQTATRLGKFPPTGHTTDIHASNFPKSRKKSARTFRMSLASKLQLMLRSIFPTASANVQSTPPFRIGITAPFVDGSPMLSDLIDEFPEILSKRPYSIAWVLAGTC